MKNQGVLDVNQNPTKAGGLTKSDIKYLKDLGWKEGVVEKKAKDVAIGFAAPELPGGFTLHNYDVPKGTEYLYNPKDERAILKACGNPTCWRYLLK